MGPHKGPARTPSSSIRRPQHGVDLTITAPREIGAGECQKRQRKTLLLLAVAVVLGRRPPRISDPDGEHGAVDDAVAAAVRGDAVSAGDVQGKVRVVGAHDHRRRIRQRPPLPSPPHQFIGNYQEASGIRTGWGAVVVAELVALIAAGTVHRVCITTCFLFSAGFLYEIDKLSGMILGRSESTRVRRH